MSIKSDTSRVPSGFIGLEIYGAYFNPETKTFVLLGEPESAKHNCDAMGCGTLDHVLVYCTIPDWQAEQLATPCPDCEGSGEDENYDYETFPCGTCKGTGLAQPAPAQAEDKVA